MEDVQRDDLAQLADLLARVRRGQSDRGAVAAEQPAASGPGSRPEVLFDPLQLLTVEDVARLFGVTKSWVYHAQKSGLPSVKLAHKQLRFRRADLQKWLDDRASGGS